MKPISSDDAIGLYDWYIQTAMAGATAVRENGIKRVVNISSIGARAKPNLGTVSFVGEVESIFNQTGGNILHLRPGYFMENFLSQVKLIQQEHSVSFPYASDQKDGIQAPSSVVGFIFIFLIRSLNTSFCVY